VKIYTRTGDLGETALFGGGRVPKSHQRVAAYGEVDELNSSLGAAIACSPADLEAALLESIQRDLFAIGGRLASPEPEKVAKALTKAEISENRIRDLEQAIDRMEGELRPLDSFVLPGGSAKAASFHVARTICRRAERAVVGLAREDRVPAVILTYLNRLSDLLFTLARLANARAGVPDRVW
jgi:cob(I)alamin adenosyltransferase